MRNKERRSDRRKKYGSKERRKGGRKGANEEKEEARESVNEDKQQEKKNKNEIKRAGIFPPTCTDSGTIATAGGNLRFREPCLGVVLNVSSGPRGCFRIQGSPCFPKSSRATNHLRTQDHSWSGYGQKVWCGALRNQN